MASTRLADEYELCRKTMQQEKFEGASPGIRDILKVRATDGPAVEHYHQISHFRDVTLKFKEADKLMEAAGIKSTGVPSDTSVLKAASLKLVRHLYLVGARGSQQIWVVSTPKSYLKFPSDELDAVKASVVNLKAKLADVDEQFSTETKNCLSSAMQLGL